MLLPSLKQEWWFYRDIPWDITINGDFCNYKQIEVHPIACSFFDTPILWSQICAFVHPSCLFFGRLSVEESPAFWLRACKRRKRMPWTSWQGDFLRGYCGLGNPAPWMVETLLIKWVTTYQLMDVATIHCMVSTIHLWMVEATGLNETGDYIPSMAALNSQSAIENCRFTSMFYDVFTY